MESKSGGIREGSVGRILVITHQLSRTGAPIVLLDLVRICQKSGYEIDMISMQEGTLRDEVEQMGISLEIQQSFYQRRLDFLQRACEYDLVIANTLITYEVIHCLKDTGIPVIWWLHEGEQYFEYFQSVLPDFAKLSENIHVYAVGHYVQEVVRRRYGAEVDILHFGIEDVGESDEKEAVTDLQMDPEKIHFLISGTYSKVKAQDVLAAAIDLLPQTYQDKMEFLFYGNEELVDEEVYAAVRASERKHANVHICGAVPRDVMLRVMRQADCLIVPSRVDPIPTVAVEMMMMRKPVICTDVCGVAHYIVDGENGYTIPPEDPRALAEKLRSVIDQAKMWGTVAMAGRKVYEAHFSPEVIVPQIYHIVAGCMEERSCHKLPLSVCMIARNEETVIERCLQALHALGGEIVVVDTGSTDRTAAIAKCYTKRVYGMEWTNDFAFARNQAISYASEDVILSIDADEFLDPVDKDSLVADLNKVRTSPVIGRLLCRNQTSGDGGVQESQEWISRLFSKRYFEYRGRIHEQVVAKVGEVYPTFSTGMSFLHVGYNLSDEEREKKAQRNLGLLQEELTRLKAEEQRGAVDVSEIAYVLYQMGKSYYFRKQYDAAIDCFSQGLSYDLDPKLEYVIDMVETYGYALINHGQAETALFFENIYDEFGDCADFKFLMGLIYMNNARFEDAIREFELATTYTVCKTSGVNDYLAIYNMGVIYECLGQREKALAAYQSCGDYEKAQARLKSL